MILIVYYCILSQLLLTAQSNTVKIDTAFQKGIYIESLDVTVPWKIAKNEEKKSGNPYFYKDPKLKNRLTLKWDSVKILGGTLVNLQAKIKPQSKKSNSWHFTIIYCYIDSNTAQNLITLIENYTMKTGYVVKLKKYKYTRWRIDNMRVIVGNIKHAGYVFAVERV